MAAVMGALGEGFWPQRPAQAVLGKRGGSGAGARQGAAGGFAFAFEGGHQHAGAEQGNSFAPQARPGGNRTVLDGDGGAVGDHDPRGDVAGPGDFRLTVVSGPGGVIGAGALIAPG